MSATNSTWEKRNRDGELSGAFVGYNFFADLADSLPSLSDRDRSLLALTGYAVTWSKQGDWFDGDWERVGIANFLNEPRLPDGRSLAEAGCEPWELQAVTFTVKQASEALGYPSPNGAQGVIDRALETGRLYLARTGSKGHATLYVVGPIVWEVDDWMGNGPSIITYSKPRKSNKYLVPGGLLGDILRAEGIEGLERWSAEQEMNKETVDRILGTGERDS